MRRKSYGGLRLICCTLKLTFVSVFICNCFWKTVQAWKRSRNWLRIIDTKLSLLTELKAWTKCEFCGSFVIFHPNFCGVIQPKLRVQGIFSLKDIWSNVSKRESPCFHQLSIIKKRIITQSVKQECRANTANLKLATSSPLKRCVAF